MYRVLDVDLEKERFSQIEVGKEEVASFLGGKGLADRMLYKNLEEGVDPLSKHNVLVFMAGPLSATPSPSSGRMCAVSKSPLTGTVAESHCGGYFALALRKAGYLGIVLRGRAGGRVYLSVGREPRLEDAEELWGRDTEETDRVIKSLEGKGAEALTIGRGGENMVRFASVIHQGHRAFGRAGMGAVMGSKNLKAISAGGGEKIPLAQRGEFLSYSRGLYQRLAEHPTTGTTLKRYGTPNVLSKVNYLGLLPTRNFSSGVFESAEKISGEEVEKHIQKSYGCFGCTIKCGKEVRVGDSSTRSLEYETLFACGSNLGIDSLEEVVRINQACNLLGLDTISFGVTLGSLVEGVEQGRLEEEISWGQGDRAVKLAEKIAEREGIGNLLAEGSRTFWKESGNSSLTTKGMELPGYDPRGARGVALAYATSNRGACHLRAPVYVEEIIAQKVDRRARDGKAALVKGLQDFHSAIDSLIMCKFTSRELSPQDYARLFHLATGIEMDGDRLLEAGERIFNLERWMNCREGFDRAQDTLPARLLEQPLQEGPSRGMKVDLENLDEYYRLRGWDKKGRPEKEKLRDLGIL